jgi:hypothetical protein
MVLQGTIDRLTEVGRCYGLEMNVLETKVMRISRRSPAAEIIIGQKQLGNVMMQDVHMKLNTKLPWQKQHATRRLFTSKLDLINLGKKLVKWYISDIACVELKLGQFGK